MKELSIEEKAEAYDKAIGRARKELDTCGSQDCDAARQLFRLFPKLKESEDEKIRKAIISHLEYLGKYCQESMPNVNEWISWLEKQGKHANFINKIQIGDKVTRNKDGALVNLSQLNRVAKKDEKQGGQKPNYCHHEVDLSNCSEEYRKAYYDGWNNCNMQHSQCKSELDDVVKCLINGMKFYYEDNEEATWGTDKWSMPVKHIIEVLEKQGEQNPADKAEPKFKVGDWICHTVYKKPLLIVEDLGEGDFRTEPKSIITAKEFREGVFRLWTIQDAKDGDVLCCESGWTCIFKAFNSDISFSSYCFMDSTEWFCETGSESHTLEKAFIKAYNGNIYPATKEQCDLLFQKMKESGYEWDAEKKELKKIEQDPADADLKDIVDKEANAIWKEINTGGSHSVIDSFNQFYGICLQVAEAVIDYKKPTAWNEEDELRMENILSVIEGHGYPMEVEWLKSIKCKNIWKPSDEQMDALETAVSSLQSTALESLYNKLKKL